MRVGLLFLVCPLLSGCLAFAYPSVSKTPAIRIAEPNVQAFRVVSGFTQSGPWLTGPIEMYKTVEKLSATDSLIAPQSDAYCPYYYLAFPVAEGCHQQSLTVLLYRRGYEPLSFPAATFWWISDQPVRPEWNKAENLQGLEAALKKITPSRHNQSPGGEEVRQFLAQEYDWLAHSELASGPDKEKDRRRLLEKVKEQEKQETIGQH
jgi:hypothetical protein